MPSILASLLVDIELFKLCVSSVSAWPLRSFTMPINRCISILPKVVSCLVSVGNHVTVLQLVRGNSARLGSALGRWNPVEQTGLCIYSCFRTYRSELFNRVLSNQQTLGHLPSSLFSLFISSASLTLNSSVSKVFLGRLCARFRGG